MANSAKQPLQVVTFTSTYSFNLMEQISGLVYKGTYEVVEKDLQGLNANKPKTENVAIKKYEKHRLPKEWKRDLELLKRPDHVHENFIRFVRHIEEPDLL